MVSRGDRAVACDDGGGGRDEGGAAGGGALVGGLVVVEEMVKGAIMGRREMGSLRWGSRKLDDWFGA